MRELIKRSWNGFEIEFELIDGQLMANATSMCAAFGKRPGDWTKTASAKRFIEAKGKKIVLAENQMVCTKNGGDGPGTWIHECLIRKLAEWLNVDFEVQCDEWLTDLLRTGKVELAPMTAEELMVHQAQALLDQSRRLKAVEAEQEATRQQLATVEKQVAEVAAKQTTIDTSHYTVAGYASKHKIKLTPQSANGYGRRAASMSRSQGYAIGHVHDAKYGSVGTYHIDILVQVFAPPTTAIVRVPPPKPQPRV